MTEIAGDLTVAVRDLMNKPHYVEQTEFPEIVPNLLLCESFCKGDTVGVHVGPRVKVHALAVGRLD